MQYTGGQKVTYDGHLWTAKWWSYGDTPGGTLSLPFSQHAPSDATPTGAAGDWTDDGACTTNSAKQGQIVTVHYESKAVPTKLPIQTPKSVPSTKNSRVYNF